jgi:hypothetical protein
VPPTAKPACSPACTGDIGAPPSEGCKEVKGATLDFLFGKVGVGDLLVGKLLALKKEKEKRGYTWLFLSVGRLN